MELVLDTHPLCGFHTQSYGAWFKLIHPPNRLLRIKTCDTCFDTLISVYSSSTNSPTCNSLKCIGFSDDNNACFGASSNCTAYNSRWSSYSFCAQTTLSYWIYVTSYSGFSTGNFTLYVEDVGSCTIPANDICDSATQVSIESPSSYTVQLDYASGDLLSCDYIYEGEHSVWYTFLGDGNFMSITVCSDTLITTTSIFSG